MERVKLDEDVEIEEEKKEKKLLKPIQMTPRSFRVQGERVISKALADRQYNVKLVGNRFQTIHQSRCFQFEDEVEVTENGDCYATVISGCLAYLLRKETIIELLTNQDEIAMM